MTPSSSPDATRFSFRHNTREIGDLPSQLARLKDNGTYSWAGLYSFVITPVEGFMRLSYKHTWANPDGRD